MAKQKPTSGRTKKPNRTDAVSTQFFMDGETAYALSSYLGSLDADEKVSKKVFLIGAIRKALQAKGYWPPPADPPK